MYLNGHHQRISYHIYIAIYGVAQHSFHLHKLNIAGTYMPKLDRSCLTKQLNLILCMYSYSHRFMCIGILYFHQQSIALIHAMLLTIYFRQMLCAQGCQQEEFLFSLGFKLIMTNPGGSLYGLYFFTMLHPGANRIMIMIMYYITFYSFHNRI